MEENSIFSEIRKSLRSSSGEDESELRDEVNMLYPVTQTKKTEYDINREQEFDYDEREEQGIQVFTLE